MLLISALVLLRVSVPAHPAVPGAWLTDSRRRAAVAIALNLIPFAGIAFLWFVGVVRDRIGGCGARLLVAGGSRSGDPVQHGEGGGDDPDGGGEPAAARPRIPVTVAAPLRWISPNAIRAGGPPPARGHFLLRGDVFRRPAPAGGAVG